ncbi:hypothetical protein NKR23_g7288 [Pleurostoma richardsiae]|uniref:SnoaL-like domain-containing protein n=1 Tax=Pleurostoma richardsiae TaxID=41990 RepID=A0AA38RBT2_9PEZI|nr:hypothetical protein NKR23_g7288 [Pleurostoma richardsiae]
MAATADIQAETLERFIEGWKAWTPESLTLTWSEDFQQRLLPYSLGVPPRSRAEAAWAVARLVEVLSNYKFEVINVVHDVAKGKAVVYAKSFADTSFGDFKWANEYAFFVTFTEDGKHICAMDEMVDTEFFKEFFPKFQGYLSKQGDEGSH